MGESIRVVLVDHCQLILFLCCTHAAHSSGDLSAHINLAHSYSNGEGVEQSSEKAFEHYLIACKASKYCSPTPFPVLDCECIIESVAVVVVMVETKCPFI